MLPPHLAATNIAGAALFAALSLPSVNELSNSVFGAGAGVRCPTGATRALHTVVFLLVSLLLLLQFGRQRSAADLQTAKDMVPVALFSALLFFFLASPDVYRLTNRVLRASADASCPAPMHILAHSAVFLIISHVLSCWYLR